MVIMMIPCSGTNGVDVVNARSGCMKVAPTTAIIYFTATAALPQSKAYAIGLLQYLNLCMF
jgi:hypothetical protein